MTFSNAFGAKDSINKYSISRGMPLKYVENETTRLRVEFEDGCPFLLYLSKYEPNPRLVV